MMSRRPQQRDPRKPKFNIWPFVAGLLLMTSAVGAQITATTSMSEFVRRILLRTKDFKVSFTYGPKYPLQGQSVQFMEISTGNPTSWLWDFGDGSKSTARNPSHAYASPGFRKVTLVASNGTDSRRSFKTLTVMAESTSASFSFTPSTPGPGQLVAFTDLTPGPPTSWRWDFGDGSTSGAKNPTHVYPAAASYTVTLTTNDGSGPKQASKVIRVVSMNLLTTSFTYSPKLPVAGRAVQFTDMSAGSPTAWLWDFGDGKATTVRHPTHIFAAPGFYTVKLTAKSGSESKTASHSITVVATAAPEAAFSFNPASPVAGQPVAFTDASSGDPTSWQWQFGDGGSSADRNPGHAYANSGSYTVTLTATSSSGSGSLSQTINVLPASSLAADFAYAPASPVLGQAVAFMDASTGTPDSWLWEFGDGATGSSRNPSHTYAGAGAYSVTLTVTSGPNSSRLSKTLSVANTDAVQAASASYADVSAAIAMAKAGDTVIVPAGQAVWKSQLVISKGVKLVGAGPGSTVITSGYAAPTLYDSTGYLIAYLPAAPELNEPFRLSGFTFNLAGKCQWITIHNRTATPITQVRIDHNAVSGSSERNILIKGAVYGVIDNNDMTGGLMLTVYGSNALSWTNFSFDFGTADNIYFEDNTCTIDFTPHDGGVGGRYCARFNKYTYVNPDRHLVPWFDMHGNQGPGNNWAGMGVEIYGNVLEGGERTGMFACIRGGKALVYDNTIRTTSTSSAWNRVREEFDDSLNPPAVSPVSGQPQHVSDTYIWGNNQNGRLIATTGIGETVDYGGLDGTAPRRNAHFWDHQPNFDGTSGIGVGPLADRPAKGVAGVGYWATDVKKLYRWSKAGSWEEFYAPYAYPHPLRDSL